jgi:hypothetical protein
MAQGLCATMILFAICLETTKQAQAQSEFGIKSLGPKAPEIADESSDIPPWGLKLQQRFNALKTEVDGVMKEQQRLNEQQQRLADSETMQAKMEKAIERSAHLSEEERSKSASVKKWQNHESQRRHSRHRTGEPALHDLSNHTTGTVSSCPNLRMGHVIFLEPRFFTFGYYVDISILDVIGRKVRVGHVQAAMFNWHSKLYLTDVNGQVLKFSEAGRQTGQALR